MSAIDRSFRIGIDIGGTFTDLVLLAEETGELFFEKTLTTPADPSVGVVLGLDTLLRRTGVAASSLRHCIHATTLVANALIERKGAKTALITTRGFRDVLEIGRELRYDLYDLFIELPPPLVSRPLRVEIDERIDADGSVTTPIDSDQVHKRVEQLVDAGAESIAVCLLHSYVNSAHEQQVENIIAGAAPELNVSSSYRIAPEVREYERSSTVAANAYVQPLVSRYLGRLEANLKERGHAGALLMMTSAGGVTSARAAGIAPITLVESGPAAGALVAAFYGALATEPQLIAFDMGGTTAKACLIENGQPLRTYALEAARVHRFKRGSGLPLKIPSIDLIEIGAGGGSIAYVDRLGLLKVGPESAGADPGPACYGRGGLDATVTDADLLLGYLDANYFLAGEMRLDRDAAQAAVQKLADQLNQDAISVANGIHEIVTESMASAARVHIAEHGRDPRNFALVATGGAGPVHAYRLARTLRIQRVLCPLGSGVASTIGLLVAQPRADYVHAYVTRLDSIDWCRLNAIYDDLRKQAFALLAQVGVAKEDVHFDVLADMRYVGQGFEVPTALPTGDYSAESADEFAARFENEYAALYGRIQADAAIEIVNWRLRASAATREADSVAKALATRRRVEVKVEKGSRAIYVADKQAFIEAPVFDRYAMQPGATYSGPAVVEERESTVIVGPDTTFEIDDHYTLRMELRY